MVKVLIPSNNEEKNIARVVGNYKLYGQVVVCDNNSVDRTADIAKNEGAKVIFEKKKGKGYAIRALLREKSDIYVLVDADNAFYAEDCKKMIDLIRRGKADMVIGRRIDVNVHNKNSPILRSIFLGLLKLIFTMKFGKVDDFMSGYRVFNRKVRDSLRLNSEGFDVETEITIQALKNNFRIIEIHINAKPRRFGKQKSNILNVGLPVLRRIIFS